MGYGVYLLVVDWILEFRTLILAPIVVILAMIGDAKTLMSAQTYLLVSSRQYAVLRIVW